MPEQQATLSDDDIERLSKIYTQLKMGAVDELDTPTILEELKGKAKRYRLRQFVGEGGYKKVYSAIDELTGRKVALATLPEKSDQIAKERFLREARITASLQHPNIIPIYDMGIDEEGEVFFSMKLIEGQSLADVFRTEEGRVADKIEDWLELFVKIAEAIAYAHAKGIVHLDLKPENIQLSTFGEVLVCDWGLAVVLGTCGDPLIERYSFDRFQQENITLKGTIKGTPGYMAPEQARAGGIKDERTDLYALGAILYRMLYGSAPGLGSKVEETIENTLSGQIESPKRKVAGLHSVVTKALATHPEDRYASVQELCNEVDRYRHGMATQAEKATWVREAYLLVNRNRLPTLLSCVFLSLLIIVAGIMGMRLQAENRKLEVERTAKQQLEVNVLPRHYKDGLKHFYEGSLEKARREMASCLEIDPDYLPAKNVMGKIAFFDGDFSKAKELLKDPQDAWGLVLSQVEVAPTGLTDEQGEYLFEQCLELLRVESLYFIESHLLQEGHPVRQQALELLYSWEGRTRDVSRLLSICQKLEGTERDQLLARILVLLNSNLRWPKRRLAAQQGLQLCDGGLLSEAFMELMPANLAWKTPVVALGKTENKAPQQVVDGVYTGFWGVKCPAVLTINLTDKRMISQIRVFFHWKKRDRSYQFKISTSLDGVDFDEVLDQSLNSDVATDAPEVFDFSPRKARFVRFNFIGGQPFNATHIREIEVYE